MRNILLKAKNVLIELFQNRSEFGEYLLVITAYLVMILAIMTDGFSEPITAEIGMALVGFFVIINGHYWLYLKKKSKAVNKSLKIDF